jgi:DNA-binding SARP family transcriptional activator/predicted ATPase
MAGVTLALLGPPQITRADGTALLRARKEQALLAYLAVEQRYEHSRDTLLGMFWPESPEEAARNSLRVALANLRAALGEAAGSYLSTSRHSVQFSSASDHTLDVAAFGALLTARHAHRHEHGALCAECAAWLSDAIGLYRGDFLSGFALPDSTSFEEWALVVREQLHQQALEALSMLAAYHDQQGDYAALARAARRQIELEPWREQAHRQLMRALAAMGDRAAALAAYERCHQVLEAELGFEPDAETRSLYERISAGELSCVTSSAPAPAFSLPAQLTPFVGRERELAELAARLGQADVRLLTLAGAGGMGKTRLALEIVRLRLGAPAPDQPGELVESSGQAFPNGVFFVSLAALSATSQIVPAIAAAIGLTLHGDPKQVLLRFLHDKRLLLILDNFEHLLEGSELVVEILQTAPLLHIIATSRERLNVRGEQIFLVEGMEYATADAATSSAVRLFIQCARRVLPGFKLSQENSRLILRICELVQGMPLGIELAAAWVEMLPLETIAAEIERSADFLAFDWRDAPARQRSMRTVFDWSWHLLNAAEQQALRGLAVFRGGCTLAAAQAVVNTSLRVLTSLVHKSLLRWNWNEGGAGRYEMHELLRQFAAHSLDAADERAVLEARHSDYYLSFVQERERRLTRDDPQTAVAGIRSEIGNILQAWAWAARSGRLADLDRSAYGIWQFQTVAGSLSQGAQLFGLAAEGIQNYLQQASIDESNKQYAYGVLSKVLAMRASHLLPQGSNDQSLALAQQAIALAQQTHAGIEGAAIGYLVQGQALRRKGYSSEARDQLIYAAQLAQQQRAAGAQHEVLPEVEWRAYNWLCSIALTEDDYGTARQYAEAGLAVCRSLGKRMGEMACLTDIVDIALASGDYQAARHETEYTIQLAQTIGYQRGLASMQTTLGHIALLQGEYTYASMISLQARAGCQAVGDILRESYAVHTLAYLHLLMGDYIGAEQWLNRHASIMQIAEMPPHAVFLGLLPRALLAHAVGDHEQALIHAEQALQMAQQLDGRSSQAYALVILGIVYAGATRFDDAAVAYEQALTIFTALGHTHLAAEPSAGLARLALEHGDLRLAQQYVNELMETLAEHPRAGLYEPFVIYLTCYRILLALDDPRAATVAQKAHSLLQAYADQITDATLRRSFLANVPAHHAILTLAHTTAPPVAVR